MKVTASERRQWVRSGAYRTIPLNKWVRQFRQAVDQEIAKWFRA